ncbi:MAG: DUF3307 domain-containing protein [Candidatus Zixiibacteriota bacterium]|jgi:hypothetical protein
MTIFEALLMAHLLGDWILQTEWQAKNKEHNWLALLIHVSIYHVIVFAVLFWGFDLDIIPTVSVVVVLAVFHAVLDRRTFVNWLIRSLRITVERKPEQWLLIAVDQSLHLLLLGAAAIVLSNLTGVGTLI